jgi:hypothetical protein
MERIPDDRIPADLKPWVAKSTQGPTAIVNPCYIDFRAMEDLAFYHPGFSGTVPQAFRHIAVLDELGRPCVCADSLSPNWHEKMVEVVEKLRFFPTMIDGVAALVDTAIGDAVTRDMHGWKVTKWTVVNGRDSNLDLVHQDLVDWTKGALTVQSIFSWRPYMEMSPLPSAPAFSALRVHEVTSRGRLFML